MVTAAMCGFYSLNDAMTKSFAMNRQSLANIFGYMFVVYDY